MAKKYENIMVLLKDMVYLEIIDKRSFDGIQDSQCQNCNFRSRYTIAKKKAEIDATNPNRKKIPQNATSSTNPDSPVFLSANLVLITSKG